MSAGRGPGAIERPPSSPFTEFIGGRFEEWSEDCVRISLVLEPHHTNPNGVMHGGVVTSLMDETLGHVIAAARGLETIQVAPHSTVEMNASFLAAARPGDRVVVEGRVLRLGKSIAFGEAEARRGDGELIAKGRLTFVIHDRSG